MFWKFFEEQICKNNPKTVDKMYMYLTVIYTIEECEIRTHISGLAVT